MGEPVHRLAREAHLFAHVTQDIQEHTVRYVSSLSLLIQKN